MNAVSAHTVDCFEQTCYFKIWPFSNCEPHAWARDRQTTIWKSEMLKRQPNHKNTKFSTLSASYFRHRPTVWQSCTACRNRRNSKMVKYVILLTGILVYCYSSFTVNTKLAWIIPALNRNIKTFTTIFHSLQCAVNE